MKIIKHYLNGKDYDGGEENLMFLIQPQVKLSQKFN